MHVWVIEIKRSKDSKWDAVDVRFSRDSAQSMVRYYRVSNYYNARVLNTYPLKKNEMPCNSDYMGATGKERLLSQVACLIDELNGQKEINKSHWDGYHPKVYSQHINGDKLVAELCTRLQNEDVSKFSLEMQVWWRDHQKADKNRLERE